MADKQSEQVDGRRRRFLNAAKGAGALGAIAVLFGKGAAAPTLPQQQAKADDKQPDGGYHETEHIREYYRSARYW
ncbi:secreted protein [Paucimonas lemoignei]|uniref:Secreted protein n=1 Tax=Paucimonas lemoignei TaxID=29443 RepID=A0A4V2UIF6_PAULE|nr:formate dehydrogenase [Paucimonas lemoignei]TCS35980.1 secreted protein [Paucimonas lemoignei]